MLVGVLVGVSVGVGVGVGVCVGEHSGNGSIIQSKLVPKSKGEVPDVPESPEIPESAELPESPETPDDPDDPELVPPETITFPGEGPFSTVNPLKIISSTL